MTTIPPRKFNSGEMVKIKDDPNRVGIVLGEPLLVQSGWNYRVFFSTDERPIIAEQDLLANDVLTDHDALQLFGDSTDFLRYLVLIKRREPLSDNLYALYSSRIKFEVYQFRPLVKFLSNPDYRLLIADEVGLGKTIEAGIILQELRARHEVSKVLIVCPSSLRSKWKDEMRMRFDETFDVLDAQKMRWVCDENTRYGESISIRGIVSLETIRRGDVRDALTDANIEFDLIVIDEAHHCRNRGTLSNDVASFLSESCAAMLLLTATPLQLGTQDLFHLLQILAPTEFDNADAFDQILLPNHHINEASRLLSARRVHEAYESLRRVETTNFRRDNPYYKECLRILSQEDPSHDDLILAQKYLLEINTLSHIFTRTRKRDVYEKSALREAHTLTFRFTPVERRFYDAIVSATRDDAIWEHGWVSAWAVIMRERQAASCISAAREHFQSLIEERNDSTSEDAAAVQGLTDDAEDNDAQNVPTNRLRAALTDVEIPNDVDTKFEKFREGLQEVLSDDSSSKIIVFSFFRGTLQYLDKKLKQFSYGVRMIHGGISVVERERIIEDFRFNPKANILLSSEVGSEGLDFQFCNTLFNYDLPWNPMKVEQRIGRLDRFGQTHSKIRIYNLMIEDSIEDRIFNRLFNRIQIFERSIGDIEAILGDQMREISRQIFSSCLTVEQEKDLADRAIDIILRKKRDIEEFEEQRLQFMGQDKIFTDDIENMQKTGRFISESETRALVTSFVRKKFPQAIIKENGDGTYALTPDISFVQDIRNFVYKVRYPTDFLKRLDDGKLIPLTFSSSLAYERKLVEFITLNHPLARAAEEYWLNNSDNAPLFKLVIRGSKHLEGRYYFFVFRYKVEGLRKETKLKSFVVSVGGTAVVDDLSNQFLRLVQDTPLAVQKQNVDFKKMEFDNANRFAEKIAVEERDRLHQEMIRLNQALIVARLSALEQTFRVKRRRLEALLRETTEPRIHRMYTAQLKNVEAKYNLKKREIEEQPGVRVEFTSELRGVVQMVSV